MQKEVTCFDDIEKKTSSILNTGLDLLFLVKGFSDLKRTHPKCILAVETLPMWPKMSCPFQKGDQFFGSIMLQKWKCVETTGSCSTKIGYVNGGVTKASMGDC